jgi:hypothetical protein
VRRIDSHADLVHALHYLCAKEGQAAVALLLQAAAAAVGLAVGDAHQADAHAIQHIHAIHFVFQHGGAFNNGDPCDLALCLGTENVIHLFALDQEVLMGNIGQAHTQIIDHIVPLPAVLGGNHAAAVHQVIEHAVPGRLGQCAVGGKGTALAHLIKGLLDMLRETERMLMQADHGMGGDHVLVELLLLRGQVNNVLTKLIALGCQLKRGIVYTRLQKLIRLVALVTGFQRLLHVQFLLIHINTYKYIVSDGKTQGICRTVFVLS